MFLNVCRFGMAYCYDSNNTKVHIFGGIESSGFEPLVEIDLETLYTTTFLNKVSWFFVYCCHYHDNSFN